MELFNKFDLEAAKKLDAFLPDRLFDAHMHISEFPFYGKEYFGFKEYYEEMAPLLCGRRVRCNALATLKVHRDGENMTHNHAYAAKITR